MIPALLALLSPIVGKVLDKIPNPAEREKARLELELQLREQETELLKIMMTSDVAQAEIAKEEAKSSSFFVAGARPLILWVCGACFAWTFLLQPLLSFVFAAAGHPITLPPLDFGGVSGVLGGMLGLFGLRSLDKMKGVGRNTL